MLRVTLIGMGVESYEGWKEALLWDSIGYWDPLGVSTLGRGIYSLISIQLDKPKSLLASTQRVHVDRVVIRSIWSLDHRVIFLQKYVGYSGTDMGMGHMTIQRLRHGAKLWVVF